MLHVKQVIASVLLAPWKAARALFLFFFPLIVDPGSQIVRAYLFPMLVILFTITTVMGRSHGWLVALLCFFILLDKAIAAFVVLMPSQRTK